MEREPDNPPKSPEEPKQQQALREALEKYFGESVLPEVTKLLVAEVIKRLLPGHLPAPTSVGAQAGEQRLTPSQPEGGSRPHGPGGEASAILPAGLSAGASAKAEAPAPRPTERPLGRSGGQAGRPARSEVDAEQFPPRRTARITPESPTEFLRTPVTPAEAAEFAEGPSPVLAPRAGELRQALELVRRWWWMLAAFALVGATLGFWRGKTRPISYQTEMSFRMTESSQRVMSIGGAEIWTQEYSLETIRALIAVTPVFQEVARRVNLPEVTPDRVAGMIAVVENPKRFQGADLVQVQVRDSDKKLVLPVANGVKEVVIDQDKDRQKRQYAQQLVFLDKEFVDLEDDLLELERDATELGGLLGTEVLQARDPLVQSLRRTQVELADAETKYGPNHPVVQELREKERALIARIGQQEKDLMKLAPGGRESLELPEPLSGRGLSQPRQQEFTSPAPQGTRAPGRSGIHAGESPESPSGLPAEGGRALESMSIQELVELARQILSPEERKMLREIFADTRGNIRMPTPTEVDALIDQFLTPSEKVLVRERLADSGVLVPESAETVASPAFAGLDPASVPGASAALRTGGTDLRTGAETEEAMKVRQQLTALDRQRVAKVERMRILIGKLMDIRLALESVTSRFELIDPPGTPAKLQASATMYTFFGLVVALGLGILLSFLIELLDERVRTVGQARASSGTQVLAVVPSLKNSREVICNLDRPSGIMAETMRILRNNLFYALPVRKPSNVVLVASANHEEGKTSLSLSLAVVSAQEGVRTLLIEGDLRKPSIGKMILASDWPVGRGGWGSGVSDFLGGDWAIEDLGFLRVFSNLSILLAGRAVDNPSSMLMSSRMRELMEWAGGKFELILIDSPAVLPVVDAALLASFADGVLMVIDSSRTNRSAVRLAVERLAHVRAYVLGAVLNKFHPSGDPYYAYGSYYYSYGYGRGKKGQDAP